MGWPPLHASSGPVGRSLETPTLGGLMTAPLQSTAPMIRIGQHLVFVRNGYLESMDAKWLTEGYSRVEHASRCDFSVKLPNYAPGEITLAFVAPYLYVALPNRLLRIHARGPASGHSQLETLLEDERIRPCASTHHRVGAHLDSIGWAFERHAAVLSFCRNAYLHGEWDLHWVPPIANGHWHSPVPSADGWTFVTDSGKFVTMHRTGNGAWRATEAASVDPSDGASPFVKLSPPVKTTGALLMVFKDERGYGVLALSPETGSVAHSCTEGYQSDLDQTPVTSHGGVLLPSADRDSVALVNPAHHDIRLSLRGLNRIELTHVVQFGDSSITLVPTGDDRCQAVQITIVKAQQCITGRPLQTIAAPLAAVQSMVPIVVSRSGRQALAVQTTDQVFILY